MTSPRSSAGLFVVLVALGCSHPVAKLLDEDSEVSERRLRRMNLTVEEPDGSGGWRVATTDATIGAVMTNIGAHCQQVVGQEPALADCAGSTASACDGLVCASQQQLCEALTAREAATSIAPVVLLGVSGPAWRLPAQDPESRVALEQASQRSAATAAQQVASALLDASGMSGCTDADLNAAVEINSAGDTLSQSVGELLASTLTEALMVGEAAAESGARRSVGLADRDQSAISNRGRAARVAWFDRNLSRLMAIQTQVGGVINHSMSPLTPQLLEASEYQQDVLSPVHQRLVETGIGAQQPCRGACRRCACRPSATVVEA